MFLPIPKGKTQSRRGHKCGGTWEGKWPLAIRDLLLLCFGCFLLGLFWATFLVTISAREKEGDGGGENKKKIIK
jgi:hypothetical protein